MDNTLEYVNFISLTKLIEEEKYYRESAKKKKQVFIAAKVEEVEEQKNLFPFPTNQDFESSDLDLYKVDFPPVFKKFSWTLK